MMKRLQTQLILAFALVILVVLCGVSSTLLLLLRRNPQQERAIYSDLTVQARVLARMITRFSRPDPELGGRNTRLSDIARAQDLRIGLASNAGEVLFDSEHRWDQSDAEPLFPRLNRVSDGRWVGRIREDNNRAWLVLAYPVPEQHEDLSARNYLILAHPAPALAFLQQFRRSIARPLVQAGLLAFAVGLVLSLIISRSIAKSLRQVSGAAMSIAEGDLDARAPQSMGPEEVRQMAGAFNQMAERVQASQQSQQDLVANIAHDLKTPLTSIQGFAQALVDGTAESQEARTQATQAIYEESRRINTMATNLLDLARFESGQMKIRREKVDMRALVATRIRRLQYLAANKQMTLKCSEASSFFVEGDEIRLAQVLDNLLSNAIECTDEGDQITVSLAHSDDQLQLFVTDTGIGISPEDLPRIFERFYRSDKSRRGAGTGLGLAIVREIVEAHGGTIKAESVIGVGTRFIITLPTPEPPLVC